jgi:hypothetical protein
MTECYLTADGVTTRLDLEAGIPLPITYNVIDVREPDTNVSHWSKTLKLPGSKTNNKVFRHIFEIGIDGGFNPNKKADVYFLQDSLEVLRGVLQLKKITRAQNLDVIYYECNAFGGSDDLFTKLGDAKLTDLDFSAYDHVYNKTNQVNSWSVTGGSGYVYPMINYTGHGPGVSHWKVNEFFPALFVKEYVDKIFEYAGKKYSSTFFDGEFFSRLIIPYNRESYTFTKAEVESREFCAVSNSSYAVEIGNSGRVPLNNDSTGIGFDPSNVFNTTTYKWIVPSGKGGLYKVRVEGPIFHRGTSTAGNFNLSDDVFPNTYIMIERNGIQVQNAGKKYTLEDGTSADFQIEYPSGEHLICEAEVNVKAGDEVTMGIRSFFEPAPNSGDIDGTDPHMYAGVYFGANMQCRFQPVLSENVALSMNKCIPEGVQMRDFLMSLINMFRLYIEQDKDDPDKYLVATRDEYYQESIVDWSSKLDYEKGLEIIPMSELKGRKYTFAYKEDKDYWNNDYQSKYRNDTKPRTYGDKIVNVDNDFVTNEVVIQPIFSATPSMGWNTHTRVIPAMYALDGNNPKQIGTNIRILYWGGMKDFTGAFWYHLDETTPLTRRLTCRSIFRRKCSGRQDTTQPSLTITYTIPITSVPLKRL